MSIYYANEMDEYLAHHGILGMKWGKRNGPPYPLNAGDHSASEKKTGWRKSLSDWRKSSATKKKLKKEHDEILNKIGKEHKTELAEKAKNFNSHKNVSQLRNDYHKTIDKTKNRVEEERERYRNELNTNKDIKHLTERQKKNIKRALVIAGAVTVTAAAAYAANHVYAQTCVDRVLKSGTELARVETKYSPLPSPDSEGVKRMSNPFYAAYNKADRKKYLGLYGNQKLSEVRLNNQNIFLKNGIESNFDTVGVRKLRVDAKDGLKIASIKNAEKVFMNRYNKDPDFKRNVDDVYGKWYNSMLLAPKNARRAFRDPNKVSYEAFNTMLVDAGKDKRAKAAADIFYKDMKDRGYGAIFDMNDGKKGLLGRSNSGYDSKDPLIVFDTSKAAADDFDTVNTYDIGKNYKHELTKRAAKSVAKTAALYGAGSGAMSYAVMKAQVKQYRKEHPNTKLSDKDIQEMIKKDYAKVNRAR